MPIKAEMMIQVSINGRPLWRKVKTIRNEFTLLMSDKEYAKVLDAASGELGNQVRENRKQVDKSNAEQKARP